jgi:hypothetical protein
MSHRPYASLSDSELDSEWRIACTHVARLNEMRRDLAGTDMWVRQDRAALEFWGRAVILIRAERAQRREKVSSTAISASRPKGTIRESTASSVGSKDLTERELPPFVILDDGIPRRWQPGDGILRRRSGNSG